jgi:hypothetical protein
MQRSSGDALLHVAVKLGDQGIGRVAAVEQAGIGDQPAKHVINRFVPPDRFGEHLTGLGTCRKLGEPPLVDFLELDALGLAPFEVPLDRRRIHRGIEISEIPLRQGAKRSGGRLGGGTT